MYLILTHSHRNSTPNKTYPYKCKYLYIRTYISFSKGMNDDFVNNYRQ